MTNRTWKPVPGWPCYASDDGLVRGPSGLTLKPYVNSKSGHLHVLIRKRKLRVHHAVLFAFVGPRPEGMECRHLDDDPANNLVTNLRWGTRLENRRDRIRLGNEPRGEDKPGHRLTAAQVALIRQDARPARVVGAAFGVSHTAVLRIRRGQRWAAA
jgi:hypothetical protein